MRTAPRLAVLATCAALAACSPAPSASSLASAVATTSPQPPTQASPGEAATASVEPDEIVVGGDRPATVRLQTGAGTERAPLILALHGYGSSASEHQAYFRLDRDAGARSVVMAYPQGTRDRDGNRFWNATDACCNFHEADVDDVAYLVDLVGEIGRATPIDPKQVYLVGHSNGGFMSYRMACEEAATFAAIVSLAGATYDDDADCAPSDPITILQIHGTADDTILFAGGTLDFGGTAPPARYPGAKATALTWAAYDGCATALQARPEPLDVDGGIAGNGGLAETTVDVATACAAGGHAELWTIPGGSHAPNLSTQFASLVIDFLLTHPKP
jgi:polyhydroxybutyrate depolymerase